VVTHQAMETLIGGADPALTAVWERFIRDQDTRYARLARATGSPYTPFPDNERREVAAFAAALGVAPTDSVAPGTPAVPDETRELAAAR